MNLGIINKSKKVSPKVWLGLILLAYLGIMAYGLRGYIPWTSVNFIIGLVGLPFTINGRAAKSTSGKLYIAACILALLSMLVPMKIVLFMAFGLVVMKLAEGIWGRMSGLTFLTICFMSPAVQYLAGIFSFPIRLGLTGIAGNLLNFSGTATTVAGNVISFGGNDYSVDPACMGLKMMLTSLLCGVFIIAIMQKKQQKTIGGLWVISSLIIVFLLNIVSNLIRIIILVFCDIRPENKMHGVTGLLCLVAYVLLPSVYIIQKIIKNKGKDYTVETNIAPLPFQPRQFILSHSIILPLMVGAIIVMNVKQTMKTIPVLTQVEGYTASYYDSDIIRYKNNTSLVYIKKIGGPFVAEHNPAMCWLGSGYEFKSITTQVTACTKIYCGILSKGKEKLYTAWWFDNGEYRTLEQLDWRWKALKGDKPFSVINVTATDKATLDKEVERIIRGNVFWQGM